MFIINLAISDMCMITTQGFPLPINQLMGQNVWSFGPLWCKIYACVGGIFGKYNAIIFQNKSSTVYIFLLLNRNWFFTFNGGDWL